MESVLALEVGAAARRIFSKAICRRGQAWGMAPGEEIPSSLPQTAQLQANSAGFHQTTPTSPFIP